ncbi:CBM96 family carbohydrate-binding protein [Pyxidicoccus xibeiensis]|uniref:CBM96 family carbohydrate-binding protein n=1 Tax=Pyxidicoccus xibeiensis TaxID=2906759 RepID=UPI0020A7275C|nr:DNRLRE domain-containing protein [Pyxidicoccus xibeiensis]MCP3137761.1 DNRLRE domain-containing protein [Pyxidicoccus xibeiensis]
MSTTVLQPVADATVDASNPDTNFGTTPTLLVDQAAIAYESFLRFNLAGGTAPIQRATLRLYVVDPSPDGPQLFLAGAGWTETGITWNQRPARVGAAVGDLGAVTLNTWVEYDVTAQVRGRSSIDFALIPMSQDGADFSSRTGAQSPQLVVVTDDAAQGCGDQTCSAGEACTGCPADCGVCAAGALDLWVPRPHNPAFATPGGSFSAEVRGPATLSPTGFAAALRNELRSWPAAVTAATYGPIHHGKENGWRLTLAVPADLPPELFDVEVVHATGPGTKSERSLQAVKSFEEPFYILHISDQHVGDVTAVSPNGATGPGNGSVDAMKWAAPVFNVINPRFVLITGDNSHVYYNATGWGGMDLSTRRLRMWREGLRTWRVATASTTGNHDVGYSSYIFSAEWRPVYEREIGQRVYSFRMGSFYVMSNELTYRDYYDWAKADFQATFSDPTVKYRLVAQHYPDAWIDVADATYPANLLLVGHNHSTTVLGTSPFPKLSVGSAQNYYTSAFFNFERTPAGGWQAPQATNHGTGKNVFTLYGDWGAPKVSLAFDRANDGTQTTNVARVTNGLPLNFYNGRVKFVMARGRYALSGATVEAQYDVPGSKTAVLAKVNIPSSGSAAVTITPAP